MHSALGIGCTLFDNIVVVVGVPTEETVPISFVGFEFLGGTVLVVYLPSPLFELFLSPLSFVFSAIQITAYETKLPFNNKVYKKLTSSKW